MRKQAKRSIHRRRFSRLLKVVGDGVLPLIPIMGPIILSLFAEQERDRFEERLVRLIEQRSGDYGEPMGADRVIDSALTLAQAESTGNLLTQASPRNRFLYLAGRHYAGLERTLEIAEQHGFLWRSYFNVIGNPINKVQSICVGDIIALGYRNRPGWFRVYLPLVVTDGNHDTRPIAKADGKFKDRDFGPFVVAGPELSQLLKSDYDLDSKLGEFTGLAVKPLFADITAEVFLREYESPGHDALWNLDLGAGPTNIPAPVRDWIAHLG